MKKNGFLSTSMIYSFFLVFLLTLLFLVTQYVNNRNIYSNIRDEVLSDISGNFTTRGICNENLNLVDCIRSLYTGIQGENNIYFHNGTIDIDGTILDASDNSYRFAGSYANNYVCFGTDDAYCSEDYLYRIIGIIDNKIKLIKANPYVSSYWSGSNTNETSNWNQSTLNTTILNNTFYNTFDTKWKNKIITYNYKIAPINIEDNNIKGIYDLEYTSNTTNYSARIGLLTISDYLYAGSLENWQRSDSNAFDSNSDVNWLNIGSSEWVLTSWSAYPSFVYYINSDGNYNLGFSYSSEYMVRPVFFIDPSITYGSGTGSIFNPIRLIIKN